MRCARRASEGRQAAEEDEQGVLWANGQLSAPKNCRVRSLGGGNRARGARGEGLTALSQAGEQRLKELRQEGADVPLGTIEDWLEKRAKRLSAAQSNRYRGLGVSQRGGITPGGAWGPRRWPGLPQSFIPEPRAGSWHPWGPVCVAHLPRGHVQVSPHGVGGQGRSHCPWLLPQGGQAEGRVPPCPWQHSRTCLGGRGGGGAELLVPAAGGRRPGSSVASSPHPLPALSACPCPSLPSPSPGRGWD